MGLINKTVNIVLQGRNIKWYENKGYKIPRWLDTNGNMSVKRGTSITVDINDLQPSSNIYVDCKCDYCSKLLHMKYVTYNNRNHNGKTYCEKCAHKVLHSGKNNPKWNYNKTDEERRIQRNYAEYDNFIKSVLVRDNYTCVITGKNSKETELEVHHLNSYDCNIESRIDVKNGITITKNLHKTFHAKYGYGNNTKQQFLEFVGMLDLILDDYDGEVPTARWVYCITDNEIIKSVRKYAKINDICYSSIYRCCNGEKYTYNDKMYIWYDNYLKMNQEELSNYVKELNKMKHRKEIACINYKLIFKSSIDAGLYFGIDSSAIIKCCKNKLKHTGKDNDGNGLLWKYASDVCDIENYIDITHKQCEQEKLNRENRNQESLNCDSFIL